jgi:hypothetical protein
MMIFKLLFMSGVPCYKGIGNILRLLQKDPQMFCEYHTTSFNHLTFILGAGVPYHVGNGNILSYILLLRYPGS